MVHLAPAVPDWIGHLRLERVPIAGGHLSLEAEGEHLLAGEVPEGLRIVDEPRSLTP